MNVDQIRSKSVNEFIGEEFDLIVTLCDTARETCPMFSRGKVHLHKSFQDPSRIDGDEKEKNSKYFSFSWIGILLCQTFTMTCGAEVFM